MTDNMIVVDKENVRFNYRVCGIALREDQVLLFTVTDMALWDCWALPGGRVDMLEESEDTLIREMQEELGTDVKVGRLVWVVENFFKERDRSYHEIGMYYLMTLPSNASILNSEEYSCIDGRAKLTFRWLPISELESINLRPIFLRKGLQNIPPHTEHVIWFDY